MPRALRITEWVLAAAAVIAIAGSAACHRRTPVAPYPIVRQWPHDTSAYTQGLVYADGVLYESTGRYGHSDVRRVDRQTGRVLASTPLPTDRFGEGLTLLNGRLYQLTWKSEIGYVYDAATLTRVDSFAYTGEGWGLTTDGTSLIMSDGTPTLRFLDPKSFQVIREVTVRDDSLPIRYLNELEYVRGELLANLYGSDWVAAIHPATGQIRAWFDLGTLFPARRQTGAAIGVLNGLAFDDHTGHLLVTGKLWPALFALRLPLTPPETTPPPADTATPRAPEAADSPVAEAPDPR